jgi:hypothetical protein
VKSRCLRILLTIAGLATAVPFAARADDKKVDTKKVCPDAYAQAQTLRDANKLKEAREQLRVCSQSTCKAFIVKDCTGWLVEIEGRVPSIVLSAKDARAQPLTDVAVSMDGTPIAPRLAGESIEVNPGDHMFNFVAADGTKVDQLFTVLEGQKAQAVAVTIPTAASVAALKAEQEKAERPPLSLPPPPPPESFWSARRKIAVAVGGVGVAGLIAGSVFGVLAASASSQQKTDCAGPSNCSNHGQALSDHSSALSDSSVSTVAFIAGGAVMATGIGLFLLGGHRDHGPETPPESPLSMGLLVVPSVGPNVGGLLISRSF